MMYNVCFVSRKDQFRTKTWYSQTAQSATVVGLRKGLLGHRIEHLESQNPKARVQDKLVDSCCPSEALFKWRPQPYTSGQSSQQHLESDDASGIVSFTSDAWATVS